MRQGIKKALKFAAIAIVGLIIFAALGAGAAIANSKSRLDRTYTVAGQPLQILSSPDELQEGRRLAVTRGCVECHAADLGGKVFLNEEPLGKLYAPNLTRGIGSAVSNYKSEDWGRAVRAGVKPNGKPLVMMPAHEFYQIPDSDLGKIVGYIQSVPNVDREPEASKIGAVVHVLHALGRFPLVPAELIDHTKVRPAEVPRGPTAEYGATLALGCIGCHGETLSGGPIPGAPASMPIPTNLTPHETGLGKYSLETFKVAMRTGKRPNGEVLKDLMPWRLYSEMSDVELEAMWIFLNKQPGKAFGGR